MNRRRDLLHISQTVPFILWAISEGYANEVPKGAYEVIRLRWQENAPLLFYERLSSASGQPLQHLTCTDDGTKLVRRFLRSKRKP